MELSYALILEALFAGAFLLLLYLLGTALYRAA